MRKMTSVLSVRIVQSSPVPQHSSAAETLCSIQVTQVEPPRSCHVSPIRCRVAWPGRCERAEPIRFATQVERIYKPGMFWVYDCCQLTINGNIVWWLKDLNSRCSVLNICPVKPVAFNCLPRKLNKCKIMKSMRIKISTKIKQWRWTGYQMILKDFRKNGNKK